MKVAFFLNGRNRQFDVSPEEYLLETLRSHHVTSVRNGCNESTCGVCTVLLNDKPVLSCTVLSIRIEGQHVTTVEGLQEDISHISDYFGDEGADQCGFCNSGIALTIHALKKEFKNPTEDDIKNYIVGNLCRCSGYQAQLKAIKRYLEDQK